MVQKPKFRQLTAAEKAICGRVSLLRRRRRWHQYELAGEMGISQHQLASVETGRVALTSDAALKLAAALDVNLLWLAEGWGDSSGFLKCPANLEENALEHRYFKEAFDAELRAFFVNHLRKTLQRHDEVGSTIRELPVEALDKEMEAPFPSELKAAESDLREAESIDFKTLSREEKTRIQNEILFLKRMLARGGLSKSIAPPSVSSLSNSYLTDAETSVKQSGMRAQLPSLLERLNRATKESGMMSALADFLGKETGKKVPLASVSRWLSGKREPGGEVTLKLLQWVELQERQK